MKHLLKKLFEWGGVEVRLRRNVAHARTAEKQRAVVDRWKLLNRYRPQTVLDIGANEGQFAKLARAVCPQAQVICFEPLESCCQALQSAVAGDPQVVVRRHALGSRNETATIHRSEFSPSSSLLPMGNLHQREFPHTARTAEETIDVRRLDDVADELVLCGPMIAKIDVQGFECEVLAGGVETFGDCVALIVEMSCYSLYEGQPLFDEVYTRLKDLGFDYRGNLDQMVSPQDGRILQCDGLFENRRFSLPSDSSEFAAAAAAAGTR